MDNQAIPLSQICWTNLKQEQDVWRMVFCLSLAATEEAAAEGVEPKNYRRAQVGKGLPRSSPNFD